MHFETSKGSVMQPARLQSIQHDPQSTAVWNRDRHLPLCGRLLFGDLIGRVNNQPGLRRGLRSSGQQVWQMLLQQLESMHCHSFQHLVEQLGKFHPLIWLLQLEFNPIHCQEQHGTSCELAWQWWNYLGP